ncbi:MAG: hypothetical protein NVSMB65_14120 [Chloroflexota bacterium]
MTVATGLLSHPVWSPDGRSLAVVALDGGAFVIHTLPITLTGQTIGVGASQTLDATAGIDAASTLSWTR